MAAQRHPERWLLGVAVLIVTTLFAAHALQLRAVPGTLRHVPIDSEAFVVSAPLGDMWRGLQPHLAPYFEAHGSEKQRSALNNAALELERELRGKKIVLRRPDDLAGLGIDARAAAAVAWVPQAGSLHLLLVLPLLDRKTFVEALERYLGEPSAEVPGRPGAMRRIADTWVAFGDEGTALVCDDADVLQRALHGSARRLADWRSSDRIGRAFAAALPPTAGVPVAWLRGRMRAPEPLPPGGEIHFALAAEELTLGVEGRMTLPPARSQFVADLLRAEPLRSQETVLPRSDLAFSLSSAALPSLLRELSAILEDAGYRPFGGRFAPVLAGVRRSDGVQRMSVALSDTRQRVPGVVMGLQMSAADAAALVLRLQTSLRVARDIEVLRSAGSRYRQQRAGTGMPGAAELLSAGQIAPEAGALWSRYRWRGSTAVPEPALTADDFAGDTYQHTAAAGLRLQYLMPPFTANDLEHRFADKREELQLDELSAGRYRLCSSYHRGTLWIGNDASVLVDWISRLARDATPNPFTDAASLGSDAEQAKAMALLQPARLLEAGQLYPDHEINKMSRQGLADLASYRATLLGLSADEPRQELHVWATFLRR